MNNYRETENSTGASITPSARKSIHSHKNCPFAGCETMGRYGLDTKSSGPNSSLHHDQGRDEVDNVMSKFAHSESLSEIDQRNQIRRNSFSPSHQQHLDDSDNDCVLSKSAPTNLPSHSHCSEFDDYPFQDNQQIRNNLNTSFESIKYRTPQSRRNVSRNSESFDSSDFDLPSLKSELDVRKQNFLSIKAILVVAVLATIVYFARGLFLDYSNSENYDEINFYNDMNNVRDKYKISDNSILQIKTGISTISKRHDTGSFIFAYNSKSANFDQKQFNNFVNDVASTAARLLRNDSTSVHHIVVEGSKLSIKTHSELINKYREDVIKSGVMLIRELEQVPSTLAMAFHYYCDEYNPLVTKSALFFTLNMGMCTDVADLKSTHAYIEKCLAKKWTDLPRDNIRPLLSRVVSIVVDLTSEF